MTQKQTVFIATVFPDNQDKASLIGLKQRLEAEIKSSTGQAPALVRAALGASVYLICGEFTRISQALQTACDDDARWLLVRAETPHTNCGLASAGGFLQARIGGANQETLPSNKPDHQIAPKRS